MDKSASVVITEDPMFEGILYTKSAPGKIGEAGYAKSVRHQTSLNGGEMSKMRSNKSVTDVGGSDKHVRASRAARSGNTVSCKSTSSRKEPSGWHLLLLDDNDDSTRLFKNELPITDAYTAWWATKNDDPPQLHLPR